MNRLHSLLHAASLGIALFLGLDSAALAAEPVNDVQLIESKGTLLFQDDFARDEPDPGKEDIGGGWTTNSAWRAQGKKQADLADGALVVTRAPEADHGVAIFHVATFQAEGDKETTFRDGAVQLRFKLNEGEDFGIDFVDRELKSVHAGHLCMAKISLKSVTLHDSKTGVMDNEIRERRLAGDKDPELARLIKSKSRNFPVKLEAGQWHTLTLVVEGEAMRATIDGNLIGEFKSEGIAHPTKRWITLAVNKAAAFDDVKLWKLVD